MKTLRVSLALLAFAALSLAASDAPPTDAPAPAIGAPPPPSAKKAPDPKAVPPKDALRDLSARLLAREIREEKWPAIQSRLEESAALFLLEDESSLLKAALAKEAPKNPKERLAAVFRILLDEIPLVDGTYLSLKSALEEILLSTLLDADLVALGLKAKITEAPAVPAPAAEPKKPAVPDNSLAPAPSTAPDKTPADGTKAAPKPTTGMPVGSNPNWTPFDVQPKPPENRATGTWSPDPAPATPATTPADGGTGGGTSGGGTADGGTSGGGTSGGDASGGGASGGGASGEKTPAQKREEAKKKREEEKKKKEEEKKKKQEEKKK